MNKALVLKSTGKNYVIHSGELYYNAVLRGKLRLKNSRHTNPVAVGDYVNFTTDENGFATIHDVLPRKNHILRKSTKLSHEAHVIAANIDLAVLVLSLKNPKTPSVFIDRFLVSAESYNIPAILVFNKTDIYSEKEMQELQTFKSIYQNIGVDCIDTSVSASVNLDRFKNVLLQKTLVVAGQSGVGKSSLLNAIEPGLNLKIADISGYHKTGRHTTTFAEMHFLSDGIRVIDTPGIRAFGLVHIEKEELYHYFPEIFKMASSCRYHNCLHTDEPGCAVKKAVVEGEIATSRYESYLNILFDENDKYRHKAY